MYKVEKIKILRQKITIAKNKKNNNIKSRKQYQN